MRIYSVHWQFETFSSNDDLTLYRHSAIGNRQSAIGNRQSCFVPYAAKCRLPLDRNNPSVRFWGRGRLAREKKLEI